MGGGTEKKGVGGGGRGGEGGRWPGVGSEDWVGGRGGSGKWGEGGRGGGRSVGRLSEERCREDGWRGGWLTGCVWLRERAV